MSEEGLLVHCITCGHAWSLATAQSFPLPMKTMLRIMDRVSCPACDADKSKIIMGPVRSK